MSIRSALVLVACMLFTLLPTLFCPGLAMADPVQKWQEREDALLVVILLDGLVAEFVEGATADADPLMPETARWVQSCRRHEDVLVSTTDAGAARAELTAALESFATQPVRWVTSREDGLGELPAELAGTSGRQAVVVDLDWLVPPLEVDAAILTPLDPAPWSSLGMTLQIEDQVRRRLSRASRLALMQGRGAARGRDPLLRDVRWVVQGAHRAIDERLAQLIGSITTGPLATRTAVLLTATSSMGLGERGPIGLHRGAQLDVLRVPVYLRVAGLEASTDGSARQWGDFGADWFGGSPAVDRYTWAWADGSEPVSGALRWTTEAFTLVDITRPYRLVELYDRQLDPGEWLDRAVSHPALADSLRRELRARIYGPVPTLVLTGGAREIMLSVKSRGSLQGPAGRSIDPLRLAPGEVVRIRMTDGAENISFGRAVEMRLNAEPVVLEELLVHSPQWRAALADPGDGPAPGLRIE